MEEFSLNNQEVLAFEDNYEKATKLVSVWGEDAIAETTQNGFNEEHKTALERIAEGEKDTLKKELEGQELKVELILNRHEGTGLYIPVRSGTETTLEADLYEHIALNFLNFDPAASIGSLGDYFALTGTRGTISDLDALTTMICDELPEAMNLANIKLSVERLSVPLSATAVQNVARYVDIPLTQSAIDYKLIPVRRDHSNFFPRHKREFVMGTPNGDIRMWVTSKVGNGDSTTTGNYMTSTGDGALGNVFEAMQISPEDTLRIAEVTPMRRYSMERLNQPAIAHTNE